MLCYGSPRENVSDLRILASKVADIRDDIVYMLNRAIPITNDEWQTWSRSSNYTVLEQIDKMLHDTEKFIKSMASKLTRQIRERA